MASDMQRRGSGETATSAEELYLFMQRIRWALPRGGAGLRGGGDAGGGGASFGPGCRQRTATSAHPPTPHPPTHHHRPHHRPHRSAGEDVPVSELLRFSKLFNDELTLDNLER